MAQWTVMPASSWPTSVGGFCACLETTGKPRFCFNALFFISFQFCFVAQQFWVVRPLGTLASVFFLNFFNFFPTIIIINTYFYLALGRNFRGVNLPVPVAKRGGRSGWRTPGAKRALFCRLFECQHLEYRPSVKLKLIKSSRFIV